MSDDRMEEIGDYLHNNAFYNECEEYDRCEHSAYMAWDFYMPASEMTKDELLEYLKEDDLFCELLHKDAEDTTHEAEYIERDELEIRLTYYYVIDLRNYVNHGG